MAQGISKTDQVLVLLNRLAVSEASSQSPEGEHLLGEYLDASKKQYDKDLFHNSHFHMDIESQDPRRWSHIDSAHNDRRQSQNTQPAAALRIVLGDQRGSIMGERKLRQALLPQCSGAIYVVHQVSDKSCSMPAEQQIASGQSSLDRTSAIQVMRASFCASQHNMMLAQAL